jgi:hypothetical protein
VARQGIAQLGVGWSDRHLRVLEGGV